MQRTRKRDIILGVSRRHTKREGKNVKKAVGFIRYGSGRKDEERQKKAIADYCIGDNMEIIEWIGKGISDFGDVVYGNWIGHRKIDAVVAADCTDVTENVFEFHAYRCRLEMRGTLLIVTSGVNYPGYGMHRKVFEEFTKTLCRMELAHEPVRNATGRIRKASKGGYIGGQAPMGYKVEDGKLVVNPEEVPVVLFIMEEKHAGRTKMGTVERLNAFGYKTRNGGKFQISTVQGIWNNEKFYHGYYRYKGSDEWVKGQHEAILKD